MGFSPMAHQAVNSLQDPAIAGEDLASDSGENEQTDAEIAGLFTEMRASSGQTLEQLSQFLGADIGLLQALEQGNVDHLPSWEVSSAIITKYAKFLGLDPLPILRRVALYIQARQTAKGEAAEPLRTEKKTVKTTAPQKPGIKTPENNQENQPKTTPKNTPIKTQESREEESEENGVANLQPSDGSEKAIKAETLQENTVSKSAVQDGTLINVAPNPVQPRRKESTFTELGSKTDLGSNTDNVAQRPTVSIEPAATTVAYRPVSINSEVGVKSERAGQNTRTGAVTEQSISTMPPQHQNEATPPDEPIGTGYQEDNKPSKQALATSLLMPTLDTRLSAQDSLSGHFSLKTPQSISQTPSQSTGTVLADGGRAEPKLFDQKPPERQEDNVLRADRRDFPQYDGKYDGQKMDSPLLNDPFLSPQKSGPSLFSWIVIIASLLACAYIGWFIYSEPKLGEILWDKLPFLSSFSVLMDNSLINR